MKTFIKWFIATNIIHLNILLVGIIIALFWEGMDRVLGVGSFGLVLLVLIIGKYRYYKQNKMYIDEKY